ncbi:MAG: tRNA (guanosine(46)-N7)-methyltransferase TrmB [Gammaproteobacteria bacterium]
MNTPRHNRSIRSYALRGGRLTRAQARGLQDYAAKYVIEYQAQELNLNEVFRRNAGKILDIGSGMGETTLQLAASLPGYDFLAVEVHAPGVGSMLNHIEAEKLSNLRIIQQDVIDVLKRQIPADSLAAVTLYFPDPWPKKRHHKRRLVNADFLRALLPKLADHGCLYMATDDAGLAEHLLQVCDAETGLINLAGSGHYAPRPKWRPLTKFEQRGLRHGNQIRDFVYCKSRRG